MRDDYLVKPVLKAMQVLDCICSSDQALPLQHVSVEVALPKTTVFRYLRTLVQSGLLSYDPERDVYGVGLKIITWGRSNARLRNLRDVCIPHMRALRERFGETVNLGVLDGAEIVYIEIAESQHALRMQAKVGGRDPAYTTAIGKAVLSQMAEDERLRHIPPKLRARTGRTLRSLAQLALELDRARTQGFAEDNGENEEGSICVGVPIVDPAGAPIAGLSISAPAARLDAARKAQFASMLRRVASEISQGLDAPRPKMMAPIRRQA